MDETTASPVTEILTTATAVSDTLTTATSVTETLTTLPLDALPLPALPFEVVEEILCRLPVKLLLQLRCLCKSFNNLISDPKFIRKHLGMSTACHRHRLLINSFVDSHALSYPLHSTFISVTDNPIRHQFPVTFIDEWYCSLSSCDGMFCFEVNGNVFLWNPSILKFKTLPVLGGCHAYGFGFDTSIQNYKVVSVPRNNQGFHEATTIQVHTLGTNSWRMIQGEFPVPKTRSLTLASGALNWIASNDYSIVSFDLVNESCRKFLAPNYGGEAVFGRILDVLRDCLCIVARSHTFSSVWMMKEYGNEDSWTQLFRVPRSEESYYKRIQPIWIFEDDQVLMKKNKDLVLFDFKNGTFNIQMIENINICTTFEVYIESLVSPCF